VASPLLTGRRMEAMLDGHTMADLHAQLMKSATNWARNRADAEDLVQGTLARALKHRHRFTSTNARAWLHTILNNLAIDTWRKNTRDVLLPPQVMDLQPAQPAEPPPIWRFFSDEDVRLAVDRCRSPLRETYALSVFGGLSNGQIAAQLKIPVATVATRLHRARADLRKTLQATSANHSGPHSPPLCT
jgi:RNA polymerase sigma factor (sigma-70 family)